MVGFQLQFHIAHCNSDTMTIIPLLGKKYKKLKEYYY